MTGLTALLLAAAIAAPATARAPPAPSTAAPARLRLLLPDRSFSAARPERGYDRGEARGDEANRTALDHRFAPDGVVGAVGYLCHGQESMPAAARFGQSSFLGASLGYAFR